jgi:predicted type IV restriction endonuclease
MSSVSSKVHERVVAGIKKYQPILTSAKSRDVNESDTVTIVKDMLADVFGFDKYSEITSEYAIRGTFVDLAIKLNGQVQMLIEVKAIGLDPKESFIKQAVDYGVNQGVDWVVLTNGISWQVYMVYFNKPIDKEMVFELNILNINPKDIGDNDRSLLITKEGLEKSLLGEYDAQRQALSRYFIGQMMLTDSVLEVVRRELRRVSPDVRIDVDQIKEVMIQEIVKREIIEGEKADEAKRKIARSATRSLRKTAKEDENEADDDKKMPPGEDKSVSGSKLTSE